MDMALVERFGIAGLLSIFFFLILKWVLEQFKTELIENRRERKENLEERKRYLETLSAIRQDICDHNLRAKDFQTNVQAEHGEMIKSLGRINGYKKE